MEIDLYTTLEIVNEMGNVVSSLANSDLFTVVRQQSSHRWGYPHSPFVAMDGLGENVDYSWCVRRG